MNNNQILNTLIGKRIKVNLAGGRTLTGTLNKYYFNENCNGKFYQWGITTRNGFTYSFAGCDMKGYEILGK